MTTRPRSARRIGRFIPALLICLIALVAPLPGVDFVASSFGVSLPLPSMAAAGADELVTLAAAVDEPLGGERVVGADPDTEEFAVIGLTFEQVPSDPVLVRVVEGGAWSDWRELEVEGDAGPDSGSPEATATAEVVSTEPLWVENSTGYEISLGSDDARDAEVAVVRDEVRRVVTESTPFADAAVAPLGITTRSAWGARTSTAGSTVPALKLAVIHHTVSSNSYAQSQVPSILRSIQAYHMDSRGWSDIGYNFLVDKYGGIWEGRAGGIDKAVIGAHAMGFNTGSVGVSMIGDYSSATVSAVALESASKVAGWRLWSYGVDPSGRVEMTSLGSTSIPAGKVVNLPRIVGHRDVGATGCPGSVYSSLGTIRNRAGAWYAAFEATRNPVGSLDEVRVDDRRITVRGWTKDPDTNSSVVVHIDIGGVWKVVTANGSRPDVGAANPGYGSSRGYTAVLDGVPEGATPVCVYAINQGRGTTNPKLGCRDVVVK